MTSLSKGPHDAVKDAGGLRSAVASVPRRYLVGGCIAAVAVIGLTVTMLRRAEPSPATTAARPVLTVTVAAPRNVVWPSTIEISGAVMPWQEAIIGAQISGQQITDVMVEVGDQVKKGQVLARLDRALLRADEAVLLAAFEQADANYKRSVSLKEKGFISEQNILQLETQMKTTRAQLDAKRVQLRYADIVAPDDGVVSARAATLGAIATPGQELFRLIRQNRLEWRGEISAKNLAEIRAGQKVALTLPGGESASATVRQNAPSLSAESRLGTVYADVAPGSGARAGMYAMGRVMIDESPALIVPAEAVVLRDGRSYVFEVSGDGDAAKVTMRLVEIGRRQAGEVEIVTGIAETTRLSVRGSAFLNDGDHVRIAPAAGIPTPKGNGR